jgi:hypothetical protein
MIEGPTNEGEESIREALEVLRSAMNWLEDTSHFDEAHAALDEAGTIARANFPHGCQFAYRDGVYYQECPAALAHNRVGLSPGYVLHRVTCSICDLSPMDDDCSHVKGWAYGDEVCIWQIEEAEVLEVSLVGRPAQPDARITSISVSDSDLVKRFGNFRRGRPITCDRCLDACSGVARPFEESRAHMIKHVREAADGED